MSVNEGLIIILYEYESREYEPDYYKPGELGTTSIYWRRNYTLCAGIKSFKEEYTKLEKQVAKGEIRNILVYTDARLATVKKEILLSIV